VKSSSSKSVKSSSSKSVKSESSHTTGCGCPYIFTKGDKANMKCGIKPRSGNTYCSKHKKYEGSEPKVKKVLPTSKTISNTIKPKQNVQKITPVNIVLRKNKTLDKLWHVDTCMVFNSSKDRTVIGKFKNNVLVNLNEEDIEVCKSRGFKISSELQEKSDDNDSNCNILNDNTKNLSEQKKSIRTLTNEDISMAKNIQTTIAQSICNTNKQAHDLEAIFGELQKPLPGSIDNLNDSEYDDVLNDSENDSEYDSDYDDNLVEEK
jgi:hypothetical protein